MIKKNVIFIVALCATFISAAEVSAFDAGNTNLSSPYGLTKNEEQLYKSTQKVDNLESNFDALNQRLDGLTLVIESQNNRITSLQNEINRLDLNKTVELGLKDRDIKNLKQEINELTKKIDNLNKTKSATTTPIKSATKPTNTTTTSSSFAGKTNAAIEIEADKFYAQQNYEQAKPRFEYLISKNYKPAKSYFFVGEIEYFTKNYANAITNYEKSVNLFDQADYMPKLLYHTAISFDKLGQTQNANKFYLVLKSNYPNSPEAKAAPNR